MREANEADAPPDPVGTAVWTVLRLSRLLERAQEELTLPQYRLLRMVGAGGASSARIAERLSVRRPTLTAAADGLVASGYLVRESDPDDRRVVRLCLTPDGGAVLDRADTALRERLTAVLDGVSAPDRLLALLGEVADVLDERRAEREARQERAERAERRAVRGRAGSEVGRL